MASSTVPYGSIGNSTSYFCKYSAPQIRHAYQTYFEEFQLWISTLKFLVKSGVSLKTKCYLEMTFIFKYLIWSVLGKQAEKKTPVCYQHFHICTLSLLVIVILTRMFSCCRHEQAQALGFTVSHVRSHLEPVWALSTVCVSGNSDFQCTHPMLCNFQYLQDISIFSKSVMENGMRWPHCHK